MCQTDEELHLVEGVALFAVVVGLLLVAAFVVALAGLGDTPL